MKCIRALFFFLIACFLFGINVYADSPKSEKSNDLTLNQVIEMALAANHKVNIAKIDVEAGNEAKKEAFTEFFPKLRTNYTYTYFHDQQWAGFDSGGTTLPAEFGTKDNYLWTTSAIQNIFTGLAVLTGYQIADLQKQVADIVQADTELAVVLEAKTAFFYVQNAKRLLEVEKSSVKSLKDHLSVAMEYYKVGLTPKIDVLNAEVDLAAARQLLERVKNRVVVAKATLSNVINVPISAPIDTAGTLGFVQFTTKYDKCVEKALELRPGLKAAEKNIAIAKKQVRLARSKYFPNIAAGLNYNRAGDKPDVRGSDYVDKENWNVVVTGSWTFWEWGKTFHAVSKAEKGVDKAVEQLAGVEDQVRFQVKKAFHDLKTAENNINVAEKSVVSAEENLRISTERYKEQVAIITEVLDAETRLTQSRTLLTTALNDYNLSMAALNWAMGLQ